jgi:long-chain acyl-CoA synthetase
MTIEQVQRQLEYPDVPFHALLTRTAEQFPEKSAIVFGDRRISYRELDRDAGRLAQGLLAVGLSRGDRLALFMPNRPEYEIAFFGATRAGLVPTPLNPSYKAQEARYQLAEAGAAAIVVDPSLLPIVDAIRGELPSLQHVVVAAEPSTPGAISLEDVMRGRQGQGPEIDVSLDDLAAMPFSSGTTGTSKGVMLSHRNLVCNAYQFVEATASTEADVIMVFLPLYHIYGVALMADAVAVGATQVLMPRFDLATMVDLVEREGVTELYVVPPVMLALAGAPDVDPKRFESVRFIMSAAAPLAPETGRKVRSRLGIRVIQAYGMTEASPLTHMVGLADDVYDLENVGVAVADTRCRIVDLESGDRELPAGEIGEIVVAGPQVMAGYWNAPDETERALRDGWLYTGDIGRTDEARNLFLVDRKKEMIKYKAWSIAPAELEAVLLAHPQVADCAVVGHPDVEGGEAPRAYVVSRGDLVVSEDELRRFVADRVAAYKQIRAVEIVDAIPRTPSGKILRRVLKERARSQL